MENIKISIVVPVYNVEEYLEKCLDSLVNQTMKEIEIIVVNDVSPDGSKDIMERYAKEYPEMVRCVYQEVNQGQGIARNRGMDLAKGKYIMFVDSDDYVDITMCEKLYRVAYEKKCDVVCCEYNELKTDGRCNEISGYATQVMGELNNEKRRVLLSSLSIQPVCKLICKSILIDNEIYFPAHYRCGEDFAVIALLWIYARDVYEVKEALYYYRRNDESSTMRKNNSGYYDVYKVAWHVCKELCNRGLEREYQLFKEDILVRGFIEEMKFLENRVDKPNVEELQMLKESVSEHIPNYKCNLTAYMRNEPKAIMVADMLMKSIDELCAYLKNKKNNKEKATYRPYYKMCKDKVDRFFSYCKSRGYKIAVWGAGLKGKDFLNESDPAGVHVQYVVDKNEKNWNQQLETGHMILGFQDVYTDVDVVLVMNKVYFGGIYREVKEKASQIKVVNFDVLLMSDLKDDIEQFME